MNSACTFGPTVVLFHESIIVPMMRSDADCLTDRWIVRRCKAKHQMPLDGDAPNTEQCRWKKEDSQNLRHHNKIGSSKRTCGFHWFRDSQIVEYTNDHVL
jgi:hypothetical protein